MEYDFLKPEQTVYDWPVGFRTSQSTFDMLLALTIVDADNVQAPKLSNVADEIRTALHEFEPNEETRQQANNEAAQQAEKNQRLGGTVVTVTLSTEMVAKVTDEEYTRTTGEPVKNAAERQRDARMLPPAAQIILNSALDTYINRRVTRPGVAEYVSLLQDSRDENRSQ